MRQKRHFSSFLHSRIFLKTPDLFSFFFSGRISINSFSRSRRLFPPSHNIEQLKEHSREGAEKVGSLQAKCENKLTTFSLSLTTNSIFNLCVLVFLCFSHFCVGGSTILQFTFYLFLERTFFSLKNWTEN